MNGQDNHDSPLFRNIAGNTIALSIAGLTLIGISTNFLANEEILTDFIFLGLAFSFIIIFLQVVAIINQGHKYREKLQRRRIKPLVAFFAVLFGTPLFTTFAIYKGLPPTLNYFLGEPGSIQVSVLGKYHTHNRINCKGKVWLAEYRAFSNNYFCGIHEDHWNKIKTGDRLLLKGKLSRFGIQIHGYSIPLEIRLQPMPFKDAEQFENQQN